MLGNPILRIVVYTFLLLLLLSSAVLLLSFFLFMSVRIRYYRVKWEDDFCVTISFFFEKLRFEYDVSLSEEKLRKLRLRRRKKKKKGEAEEAPEESQVDRIRGIMKRLIDYMEFYSEHKERISDLYCFLRKKLRFRKLNLMLKIGTTDAAVTGIVSGLALSIAGAFFAYMNENFRIRDKSLRIIPQFNQNTIEMEFDCIFQIRSVHIIYIVIRSVMQFLLGRLKNMSYSGGGFVERTPH